MVAERPTLVPAIHPGEFVREDVLVPLKLDVPTAAKKMGLGVGYLQALVEERASVDEKAAEALGVLAGNGPSLWIELQALYDQWTLARKVSIGDKS